MILTILLSAVMIAALFLLTHSHFYQHFYPETAGCDGFHQFGFNRKSHLNQTELILPLSLPLAWICARF